MSSFIKALTVCFQRWRDLQVPGISLTLLKRVRFHRHITLGVLECVLCVKRPEHFSLWTRHHRCQLSLLLRSTISGWRDTMTPTPTTQSAPCPDWDRCVWRSPTLRYFRNLLSFSSPRGTLGTRLSLVEPSTIEYPPPSDEHFTADDSEHTRTALSIPE